MNAIGLIVVHTHASNDPEPSAEDVTLTRQVAAAGSAGHRTMHVARVSGPHVPLGVQLHLHRRRSDYCGCWLSMIFFR
jgi:hypothetical protein